MSKCKVCGYERDEMDPNVRMIYPDDVCEDCAREADGESDEHDYPDD